MTSRIIELENQIKELKEEKLQLFEIIKQNKCNCNSCSRTRGASRFKENGIGQKKYTKKTISYETTEDNKNKHIVEELYDEDSKDVINSSEEKSEFTNTCSFCGRFKRGDWKSLEEQEKEAIDFIDKEIMLKAPKEGEVQAEGLWDSVANVLIQKIKEQAVIYAGKALEHLKEKGIEWAINLSDFVLEKVQDYLWEKYQATTDENQKEVFKNKIIEKFPDSGLASKLKNN